MCRRIGKIIAKQILVFICLMSSLFFVYLQISRRLDMRFEVVKDDFTWIYQIDTVEEKNDMLFFSGWAFCQNEDAKYGNYDIILHDIEKGKACYPKMKYEERRDVNNYFSCEYDYGKSGFSASVSLSKIGEGVIYEVLLRPEGQRQSYQTNIYLVDGRIYFANPNEFTSLETNNKDIEKVIEEGVLRIYRPDFGMYVYQYEGKLFWITNDNYSFNSEKNAFIQYHLFTTQTSRLPRHCLDNGYFWDNSGFWYDTQEVEEMKSELYRVAVMELPKEYSISRIITGNYEGDWIWKQEFRPWYEFE